MENCAPITLMYKTAVVFLLQIQGHTVCQQRSEGELITLPLYLQKYIKFT